MDPIDDAAALTVSGIAVAFGDRGDAVVVAFIWTEDDDVVFNARPDDVALCARMDTVVSLCATFPVVVCCIGPSDVFAARGT